MSKSSVRSEVPKMKPFRAWMLQFRHGGEMAYGSAIWHWKPTEAGDKNFRLVRVEVRELVPPKTKRKK